MTDTNYAVDADYDDNNDADDADYGDDADNNNCDATYGVDADEDKNLPCNYLMNFDFRSRNRFVIS